MAKTPAPINTLKINTQVAPPTQSGKIDNLFDPKLEATTPKHLLTASFWAANLGISPEQATTYMDQYNTAFLGKGFNGDSAWQRIKDYHENGKKMVQLADLGNRAMKGKANDNDWAMIDFLQRGIRTDLLYENRAWLEKAAMDTAEQIPLMGSSMKAGGLGAAAGGALFAGVTAVATAATPVFGDETAIMPAWWAGVKFGGTSGTAVRAGQLEAGGAFLDLIQSGIDPKIAAYIAAPIGVINGLIEAGQMLTVVGTIPGVKNMSGPVKRAMRKTVAKVAKEQTLKKLAQNRLAKFGGFVAEETLQEVNQESTNIIGEYLAIAINNELKGTELSQATLTEIKNRYIEIVGKSSRSFALIGAPGNVTGGLIDIAKGLKNQKGGKDGATGQSGQQGDQESILPGKTEQATQAGQAVPQGDESKSQASQAGGSVVDQSGSPAKASAQPATDKDGGLTWEFETEAEAQEMADWTKMEAEIEGSSIEIALNGKKLHVKGDNIAPLAEALKEAGVDQSPLQAQGIKKVPAFMLDNAVTRPVKNQIRTAIESHGIYQEALAGQDAMHGADSLGPLSEGRYYLDPRYKGELDQYAGQPGQPGSIAGIRRLFTFDKDQGTAWDMEALERGMDSGFVQGFIEAVVDDYMVRRGSGGLSQAALETMAKSGDPMAELMAMQWDMVNQGFTMAEIDAATKELAGEYRKGGYAIDEAELLIGHQNEDETSTGIPEEVAGVQDRADQRAAKPGQKAHEKPGQAKEVEPGPDEFGDFFDFLDDDQSGSVSEPGPAYGQDHLQSADQDATLETEAFADPKSDESIAYGSREAYQKAYTEVEHAISRVSDSTASGLERDSGGRQTTLRDRLQPGKSSVLGDWRKHRRIDYTGRQVFGPQAVAELFAVYRHPRIEQFHLIYVDDDGKILGHNMMSSGLSTISQAAEDENLDKVAYCAWSRGTIKR